MRRIFRIVGFRAVPVGRVKRLRFSRVRLACLLLLGALALSGCGARVELFAAANEGEANEMLSVLLDAEIPASKAVTKAGIAISVPQQDVAGALDLLRERGLPRERFDGMGGVFRKEGMISSPLEERARYIFALSQELSRTLSQMDGVVVARVHVVLPERGALGASVGTPASAAVFIKHRPQYSLDTLRPQIRALVTHAIPGLSDAQVSVALVPAQAPVQSAAPPMRRILGIEVTRQSSSALAWTLALLTVSMLAALATALFLMWRQGLIAGSGRPGLVRAGQAHNPGRE
jgi:type III secretion protein J